MDNSHEHWAAGDAYEHFMGRWSWEVAHQFLDWLDVEAHQYWLDVGCGTGALTRAITKISEPEMVIGLDPSVDFVRYASQQTQDARFLAANGSNIALAADTFDAIISGLALNFIPQREQALIEMRRVVKPGGLVAAYVWDYAGKMEFLRYFWDAAVALDANAAPLDEGNRFPICQPDALHELWQETGFHHIRVDSIDIPTVFENFERYWQPFTVGNFPAPKYAASLGEVQRNRLRDELRSALGMEDDGSIHLMARVWAVCGYL